MRKINPTDIKIIGSFLVLLFLFTSIAIVVRYLPQQREIHPKAAYLAQLVRPTGVGSSTQWSRVGCSANWDCVNEDILNTSDYVQYQTDAVVRTDLYATSWTPPAGSTINSIKIKAIARKTGPDSNLPMAFWLGIGGAAGGGGWSYSIYLNTSWTTHTYDFGSSVGFPVQIGVDSRYNGANIQIQVAQIWAEVEYTPPVCSSDCPSSGVKQCVSSTQYQTCGNFDADCGLEWSAATSCPSGQTCSGSGVCSTSGGGTSGGGTSGGGASGGKKTGGGTGNTSPSYLETLQLQVSIPYLVGKMKIPVVVGTLRKEIEVVPEKKDYEIDVKEANIALGSFLKLVVGGNKTLLKKVEVKAEALSQTVQIGDLILGDLMTNNIIDTDDELSALKSINNKSLQGDLNADGVTNSIDWAIILINFGKKGDI